MTTRAKNRKPPPPLDRVPNAERARLARRVYKTVFTGSESFEEHNVGADLAYLLGAILTGDQCTWPWDRKILCLLRRALTPNHPVWRYISVTEEG